MIQLKSFTLVLIKINYGQIGDQTRLFYTTNPVFYTSGNRFVRRTGMFGNLTFSLVPSDNRNTRSTCPTSVFTGIGQTLMSRPVWEKVFDWSSPFDTNNDRFLKSCCWDSILGATPGKKETNWKWRWKTEKETGVCEKNRPESTLCNILYTTLQMI